MDFGALFTPLGTQMTDAIGEIFPVALLVIGVLLAIRIGVKLFKRYAK